MPRRLRFFLSLLAVTVLLLSQAACGYQFRGAENPLHDIGIRKIFVETFANKTYRPGIEYFFTKAMIREIERYDAFEIVNNKDKADAVLSGTITSISAGPAPKSVRIDADTTATIATSFSGSVTCAVSLVAKSGREIFSGSFSGSKAYPGSLVLAGDENNVVRGFNDTTALINDSEQRLAIRFLATELMAEAYQRISDIF